MSYQVLARKWRPQQFADLVGQDHVVRTLCNAIEADRVAHAYLFVGPRGTGKTSTARIFAKALNCEKGASPTPCDSCTTCKEIIAGNNLDVMEIDGASNNGVDQVRELREIARFLPARCPYKLYIIDEVHMLSIAAFNALLKILEEPPSHVKFIFATTEPQKIPGTILSRCQRFDLRSIDTKEIAQRLRKITDAEKIAIDDKALWALARGADGGLRDAESALDQMMAFQGDQIREEDVLSVFGLTSWQALHELISAILQGDLASIISQIAELHAQGKDLQRLVIELIEFIRDVLVYAVAGADYAKTHLEEEHAQSLKALAESTNTERLLEILDIIMETESKLRYALSKRSLLEAALMRCARAAKVTSIDSILKQLASLQGGVDKPESSSPSPQPKPAPTTNSSTPSAAVEPPGTQQAPAPSSSEQGHTEKKWVNDPAVRATLEAFNGHISDVKKA